MSRKYRSGRYRFVRTDAAIQAVLKTLTETNDAQPNQVVPRGRSNPWGFSGRTFGRILKGIGFRAYVVRRYQKLSERNVESQEVEVPRTGSLLGLSTLRRSMCGVE